MIGIHGDQFLGMSRIWKESKTPQLIIDNFLITENTQRSSIYLAQNKIPPKKLFHDDNIISSNQTNMKAANDHHSDDDHGYGGDADDDDDESRDDSISEDDVDDILTRSEYISCNAATLSALKFSSTFSLGKLFGIIMYEKSLFFLLWLSNIAEGIFTVNNIFSNKRGLWSTSP